jgi:uncharacterized protein with PIN domain
MSACELVQELQKLVSAEAVEAPNDCDRCGNNLTEQYARLGFTPIDQDASAVDVHVCEDCSNEVQSLLEAWIQYDRRYLEGVAFGTEPRQGTDCSSCRSPISQNPTIVAFERVSPDGFQTVFAGDFLICEACRNQLVQDATQRNS